MFVKLISHRSYPYFLLHPCADATVNGFSKIFPSKILYCAAFVEKGVSDYFFDEKQFSQTVGLLCEKALEDKNFLLTLLQTNLDLATKFRTFAQNEFEKGLEKRTNADLLSLLGEYSKKFFEFYSYGTVLSMLGYSNENAIYKKMNEVLRAKTAGEPEKFGEYLLALTNPQKRLLTQEQELIVLTLAKKASENGWTSKQDVLDNLSKELDALVKDFAWLSFDFCDTVAWDKKYYAALVVEKARIDFKKEIAAILDYEQNAQKQLKHECEKLSLTQEEKNVFELVRQLGYYNWVREFEFQKAIYFGKFIADELGKRIGLTTMESKYLLQTEFSWALANPSDAKQRAASRIKKSLLIVGKQATRILEGNEAETEYSSYEFADDEIEGENASKLRGTPACAGKAKGKVKIINTVADVHKMCKGDILVSVATSPDLISAMRKASAIITNEGGITCHAAIVSRELKIPCIVGVKNANKILKDGELVQVDASKGIILRQSSGG